MQSTLRSAQSAVDLAQLVNISPAEFMEARLLLETAIIDLVVRNASANDLAAIEECCRRGEAAVDGKEFAHWDAMLHEAIAHSTHNSYFQAVFCMMKQTRDLGTWGRLENDQITKLLRARYEREHRDLVDALRERDGGRAKQIAAQHVLEVRRNLFGI